MAQEKRRFLNTQQAKVAFKGVGQDVHVILDSRTAFGAIERELEEHLERSGKFFTGAAVTLVVGTRKLREEHLQRIRQILATHGLTIGEIRASSGDSNLTAAPSLPPPPVYTPATAAPIPTRRESLPEDMVLPRNNALLIKGPLRSGQRIYAEDNLVVFGDVNPGAELIAGGNIVVMGVLRGVAHAGVPDNSAAIITALSLRPTQLRIGQFISRSPELPGKQDSGPEIARVDAEQIVVDSLSRRLLSGS